MMIEAHNFAATLSFKRDICSGIKIWTFPFFSLDKGIEPPALRVISYPKREARAPTDYATSKILEWLRAFLVAVGQGQDHSPDTKRTAEPLHH